MKINRTYLSLTAGILSFCSSLASCSQDEFTADSDEALPPGYHPLEIVASVEGRMSRSGSKDQWFEDDEIGVRLINRNSIKHNIIGRYMLNSEGTVKLPVARYSVDNDYNKTFMDSLPMEWPYTNGTVTAWFPFEPQIDIPIGDQSEGIYRYDYLSAVAEGKRYTDVIDLKFQHKMAKVTCRIVPGDGITEEEFRTLWVRLQGHTSVSFVETDLSATGNGWIIPHSAVNTGEAVYEALLAPTEMTDKDIFRIGLTVNYNNNKFDKIFTYPSPPTIEAGKHYTYTVTVRKDRIEVNPLCGAWDDDVDRNSTSLFKHRVYLSGEELTESVLNSLKHSDNVTVKDNYLEVTGSHFYIGFKIEKNNRSHRFDLVESDQDRAIQRNELFRDENGDQCYKYNFILMAEEISLTYQAHLAVGDYLLDDGTTAPANIDGPEVIGIVFHVGKHETDDPGNYKDKDGNQLLTEIHGYALAMHDLYGGEKSPWATVNNGAFSTSETVYDGYHNQKVAEDGNLTDFPIFMRVVEYGEKFPAPENTSGWYLPSVQQLIDAFKVNDLQEKIDKGDGEFIRPDRDYWSSTSPGYTAVYVKYPNLLRGYAQKREPRFGRAIITF